MNCLRLRVAVLSVLAFGATACLTLDEGSPSGGFGGSPPVVGGGGGGTSGGPASSGNGGAGSSSGGSASGAGAGGQLGVAGVGGTAGSSGGTAPGGGPGGGGGSVAGPPKFSTHVAPLLKTTCAVAGCHDAIKKEHGMDFSADPAAVHAVLVNKMSADHCNGNAPVTRVMPGQPQSSYMIMLVEAIDRCDEVPRMPPPPKEALEPAEILMLREWITAGAKND